MIKTGKKTIAGKIKYCSSFLSRARGLMFKKLLEKDTAYVLASSKDSIEESSIHTFFMFFPIDIIWVNSKNIIVDKKENVKPFKLLLKPIKPAKYVIELNNGKAKDINIGDKVEFL